MDKFSKEGSYEKKDGIWVIPYKVGSKLIKQLPGDHSLLIKLRGKVIQGQKSTYHAKTPIKRKLSWL